MTETVPQFVEKAPHVDEVRIRHINDSQLLAAFDWNHPGLERAAKAMAEDDPAQALDAVLHHFAHHERPRAVGPRGDRHESLTDTGRQALLDAAAESADRATVSFTDPSIGRSRLYALHYLTWTTPWLDAFALTADRRWAELWGSTFDRWYAQRDDVVGEWPGLDVIWYTLGVAIRTEALLDGLETLGDRLGPQSRLRLLATVLGGCRWLAEEHDRFRPGNWQFVGACSLLRSASLLPEFRESAAWAATAHARVTEHLALDVYSDGGHLERAPSYHLLSLRHLRDAAAHAKKYLDIDLTQEPSYARMHDWPIAMSTPEGWLPPFQDSAPTHIADEAAVWTEPVPPTWRTSGAGGPGDQAWAGRLHHWLAGSKYAVSRGGWQPGDLYSAVNCGPAIPHELESHSHRASLDFVLWGYGGPLAWEAGGPVDYDAPDYHSWYQAAEAHNTVLVDGRSVGAERDSTVHLVAHTASADVFRGHHDGWGSRHQRTFVFVRPGDGAAGYWMVADSVACHESWRWRINGVSTWQQLGPSTWKSSAGTGLVTHVSETPASWRTSEGATRVPEGLELSDGTLHTLELQPTGRELLAVLIPFQAEASWSVERISQQSATLASREHLSDEIADRSWLRTAGRAPVRAMIWLGGEVRDEHGSLLSAPAADFVHAEWLDSSVVVQVRCHGRCTVSFRAAAASEVLVGDITVPALSEDGVLTVTVPEAGDWTLTSLR